MKLIDKWVEKRYRKLHTDWNKPVVKTVRERVNVREIVAMRMIDERMLELPDYMDFMIEDMAHSMAKELRQFIEIKVEDKPYKVVRARLRVLDCERSNHYEVSVQKDSN